MEERNYQDYLSHRIIQLRKDASLTQEQLADQLGISYQAVSKWENGNACPDIMFLPKLAMLFNTSIDSLFFEEVSTSDIESVTAPLGGETTSSNQREGSAEFLDGKGRETVYVTSVPWDDDGILRAVIYDGQQLVKASDLRNGECRLTVEGTLKSLESNLSVNCNDVEGNVTAGDGVNCGNIGGNAKAGDEINCGDVGGNVQAGDSVQCGQVGNNVEAGDEVNCGDVGNNVTAGDEVSCGNVGHDVNAGEDVSCGNVAQNVIAGGEVNCGIVGGQVISN